MPNSNLCSPSRISSSITHFPFSFSLVIISIQGVEPEFVGTTWPSIPEFKADALIQAVLILFQGPLS